MKKHKKKPVSRKRGRKTSVWPLVLLKFAIRARKYQRRRKVIGTWPFALVCLALLGSGVAIAVSLPHPTGSQPDDAKFPPALEKQYGELSSQVQKFTNQEHQLNALIVPDQTIQAALSKIQLDAAASNFKLVKADIDSLKQSLAAWTNELTAEVNANRVSAPPTEAPGSQFIPIVLYHDTPGNFDQQLDYLDQHGYTVVTLDQVAAALTSGALLPPKPVALTFDDGFADQMKAFDSLKSHHDKATFYIINGGSASRWCIGAGRRYNDPLQPPQGCGDAYLSWDQVRQLDRSGLITIGAHTLDHLDLASLSEADQRQQIFASKAGIEKEIGHPIRHFAYPYGSYNQTTIDLVQQAGFTTAVTTLPGDYQAPGSLYTLKRVRDTLSLP